MNGPGKWERGVERDGADNKRGATGTGRQRLSEAVRGCQRLSEAVRGCQQKPLAYN